MGKRTLSTRKPPVDLKSTSAKETDSWWIELLRPTTRQRLNEWRLKDANK